MQLLINIDKTDKQEIDKLLKGRGLLLLDNAQLIKRAVLAVFHGVPLPTGHGDLKDAEKLKKAFIAWSMAVHGFYTDSDIASIIYNSPTIIEADRSEE